MRLLGLLDFRSALALQERIVYELSGRSDTQGVLLLCEHPPTISIGREGSQSQIAASDGQLSACRVETEWVSRGGGTVLHAPGQLAIYAMLPLQRIKAGVRWLRRSFETSIQHACHELRVPAKRRDDEPGLWSRGGQIGHFGASLKLGISLHGFFLNVSPEPSLMKFVTDRNGHRVTSLQDQLLRRIPMSAAKESVIRHLATTFGYETIHTFTGHPLLKRTRQQVCLEASIQSPCGESPHA